MQKQLKSVKDFHELFEIPNANEPTLLSSDEYLLRHSLIAEETSEYLEACENKDIVGIADALGDQLYIICGTILRHGLQEKMEAIFDEIHRSNLSKLEKGRVLRREDGKVLKGSEYTPPDLKQFL